MSSIILPGRPGWYGMVSPREEEMPDFLKVIAQGFRTPKRKWEDLWRLRRGELNHVLGMRRFAPLKKYQRGILHPAGFWFDPPGAGPTSPNLQDITHTVSQASGTASRIQLGWDSDGSVRYYFGTTLANVVWADLTTQSDDTNTHTNDWWPDQPDTNEGLNWDIMWTTGTNPPRFLFNDGTTDRTNATWYLLDTVSNDMADASKNGAIVCLFVAGKLNPTGTDLTDGDIDIRATGSGSSVANCTLNLTCNSGP